MSEFLKRCFRLAPNRVGGAWLLVGWQYVLNLLVQQRVERGALLLLYLFSMKPFDAQFNCPRHFHVFDGYYFAAVSEFDVQNFAFVYFNRL